MFYNKQEKLSLEENLLLGRKIICYWAMSLQWPMIFDDAIVVLKLMISTGKLGG